MSNLEKTRRPGNTSGGPTSPEFYGSSPNLFANSMRARGATKQILIMRNHQSHRRANTSERKQIALAALKHSSLH